jgi:hypothetical protein
MSTYHPHTPSGNKGERNNSIPICHYYGISCHIRPNYVQLSSQKPWDKKHVPRDDEPGIKNQVKNLCDQVKLISKN